MMIGIKMVISKKNLRHLQGPEGYKLIKNHDKTKKELTSDDHITRARMPVESAFALIKQKIDLYESSFTKMRLELIYDFLIMEQAYNPYPQKEYEIFDVYLSDYILKLSAKS